MDSETVEKKSPSRFLGEMLKKMNSQNAPESTISQLQEVMRPPKSTHYSTLKGFSTVSAASCNFENEKNYILSILTLFSLLTKRGGLMAVVIKIIIITAA